MRNLLLKVLLVLGVLLGFSSFASAGDFEVKVGDNIIYSISGDKIILEVVDVKANSALFTAEADFIGNHYTYIFEKLDNIYSITAFKNKKYSHIYYYKKDGEFYRMYSIKTKKVYRSGSRNYFTKL